MPAWAVWLSSRYTQLWLLGRVLVLSSFLLCFLPALHLLTWVDTHPLFSRLFGVLVHGPTRLVRWMYGGCCVCLFETMSGARYMFSGRMDKVFWGEGDSGSGSGSSPASSTTPSSSSSSSLPRVTLFLSNQPVSTSFLDCLAFFSLSFRRSTLSSLYFLPLTTTGWSWSMRLLHALTLSPLTVHEEQVELLLSRRTNVSFVSFPEATPTHDGLYVPRAFPGSPSPSGRSSSSNDHPSELMFVRRPVASRTLLKILIMATGTNGATPSSSASASASSPSFHLTLVETTLAYSGSIHAEIEQKALDAQLDPTMASGSNGGWNDPTDASGEEGDEEEFEHLTSKDWSPDSAEQGEGEEPADQEDDGFGYSADSINAGYTGQQDYGCMVERMQAARRRRRRNGPNGASSVTSTPVFCTAAPLEPISFLSAPRSPHSSPPLPSPRSRAILTRVRVLPTFFSYLSGNAPSKVCMLLNGYGGEEVRSRILKQGNGNSPSKSKPSHFTEEEEAAAAATSGGSYPLTTAAGLALETWLHHRALYQEQQLQLYALHGCWHSLPCSSLSASSIPAPSEPLEAYLIPTTSVQTGKFLLLEWTAVVLTTIAWRVVRAGWVTQAQ